MNWFVIAIPTTTSSSPEAWLLLIISWLCPRNIFWIEWGCERNWMLFYHCNALALLDLRSHVSNTSWQGMYGKQIRAEEQSELMMVLPRAISSAPGISAHSKPYILFLHMVGLFFREFVKSLLEHIESFSISGILWQAYFSCIFAWQSTSSCFFWTYCMTVLSGLP